MKTRLENGFTLIEAVISIGVVAILAGTMVPLSSKLSIANKIIKVREEIRALQEAEENYYYDKATYRTDISHSQFLGPYLFPGINNEAITDDFSPGNNYNMDITYTPQFLTLWSVGADGVSDSVAGTIGDDDIGTFCSSLRPGYYHTKTRLLIIFAAWARALFNNAIDTSPAQLTGTWAGAANDRGLLLLAPEFDNDGYGNNFHSTAWATLTNYTNALPTIYSWGPDNADGLGATDTDDTTF